MKLAMAINDAIITSNTLLLQDDLDRLALWCTKNQLFKFIMNAAECKLIKFSRSKSPPFTHYTLSGYTLEEVETIPDLSLILNEKNFACTSILII